jgi:hypothetical protein
MINLEKFKVFDFNEGTPYASLTANGMTFNKGVVMKLGYPAKVKMLIDEEERLIAIQPCDENDAKGTQFYKKKASGVLSVRWNSRDLINKVSEIGGWDLSQSSYKINGTLLFEEGAMLFDLKTATLLG